MERSSPVIPGAPTPPAHRPSAPIPPVDTADEMLLPLFRDCLRTDLSAVAERTVADLRTVSSLSAAADTCLVHPGVDPALAEGVEHRARDLPTVFLCAGGDNRRAGPGDCDTGCTGRQRGFTTCS